jgi:hypothetical protein
MDVLHRHSQDCNGLVLSALDLSTTEVSYPSRSISTDVCTFLASTGRQYCDQNCHQYSQRSMCWNNCALKHAYSRFNIGPNGFVKYKQVICGAEQSMCWNNCALKHAYSRFNIGPNGFVSSVGLNYSFLLP